MFLIYHTKLKILCIMLKCITQKQLGYYICNKHDIDLFSPTKIVYNYTFHITVTNEYILIKYQLNSKYSVWYHLGLLH